VSARGSNKAVLRLRGFQLLLASRFLSGVALQMHNVAVGWFVYDLTNSAWALGLVGLFAFAPAFAFALFTGRSPTATTDARSSPLHIL
jgi:hypothetical protein